MTKNAPPHALYHRNLEAHASCSPGLMTPPPQDTTPGLEMPSNWKQDESGKRIETLARTKDFVTAVALIQEIAQIAEDENHHPDLHLTNYNRLRITSWSHDVGKVTDRDMRLAKRVETLLRDQGVKRE